MSKIDKRIETAFYGACRDIPINMLDIGKVFRTGRDAIAAGANDEMLRAAIRGHVEAIRTDKARP